MKRTISMVTGFVLTLVSVSSLKAQQVWDAKKNPTVDSISAKYQGRIITSRPALTTADIFPAIGNYSSSTTVDVTNTTTTEISSVVVSLDEQNKGIVWIEGLPQGRIKRCSGNHLLFIKYRLKKQKKAKK
jgi:hypothetical protein